VTEQDLRNAFANRETALVEVPIVNAIDILQPLFVTLERDQKLSNSKLWKKFSHEGKIHVQELCNLIKW
jgi:hypothetical protein